MSDLANTEQTRVVAEAVARAAIKEFVREHPEFKKAEIPAPLKWAAGIIAALLTAGVAGMFFWLVTTVNDVQLTLARMDERQQSGEAGYERRISRLEAYHEVEQE